MSIKSSVVSVEAPLKMMIRDLKRLSTNKSQKYPWKIQFLPDRANNREVHAELLQVWLQGSIKRCSSDTDTIVINDGTGEVCVKKCNRVPGDRSWIKPGEYCGVLACVKSPSKPTSEVEAVKLMYIAEERDNAESMWPLEVQELANLLKGSITFNL